MNHSWSAIVLGTWLVALATPCVADNAVSAGATTSSSSATRAAGTKVGAPFASARKDAARMIDWDALLPDNERANFNAEPPPPMHDYLGERGAAARQTGSIKVNQKLSETKVKLPGFVVPLVVDDTGLVSEFFLVPYFGACIHVPPPPPNQIVYVKLSSGGVRLKGSPEDAFWVTGILHTQVNGNSLAKAAYTLDATKMELYKY
jgi:uncharacterized protein